MSARLTSTITPVVRVPAIEADRRSLLKGKIESERGNKNRVKNGWWHLARIRLYRHRFFQLHLMHHETAKSDPPTSVAEKTIFQAEGWRKNHKHSWKFHVPRNLICSVHHCSPHLQLPIFKAKKMRITWRSSRYSLAYFWCKWICAHNVINLSTKMSSTR